MTFSVAVRSCVPKVLPYPNENISPLTPYKGKFDRTKVLYRPPLPVSSFRCHVFLQTNYNYLTQMLSNLKTKSHLSYVDLSKFCKVYFVLTGHMHRFKHIHP